MGKREVKWEDLSIDEKELLKDMYFKLHPAGWRRNRGGFSLPHAESQKWFDPVRYSEASKTYYGWEPDGEGGMKRDAYGLDRKQPSRTYKLRAVLKELENEELVKGKHEFTKGRKDVDSWYTMTKKGDAFIRAGLERDHAEEWEKAHPTDAEERSKNLTTRVSAFIFFVAGLSFAVASEFSKTGHAIASTAPALASLPGFLSILLASIGGYLFIKSK